MSTSTVTTLQYALCFSGHFLCNLSNNPLFSLFCQEHLQKRLYYILANGYAGPFENRFTVRFWFEPLFIAEVGDTSVVFDASDQMVADWVEENYIGLLTSALKTAGIFDRSISFETVEDLVGRV